MRTITVDDDIYEYIAQNTQEIGEPASNILRRLLGLTKNGQRSKGGAAHELEGVLKDPKFLAQTAVVDKFLFLLGAVQKQKKAEFEKVLAIQGRGRTYFAKSKAEVEKSGNSTQPRNIPGTAFWVMTNSPTPQKQQMLSQALRLLEYSDAAIAAAVATLQ